MRKNWPWLIASVALAAMTCSSCSLTERLDKAATTTGKIQAGINLPALPADCRAMQPHYAITEGMEARSVIVGERSALNKANARVGRCATFYDGVRTNFAATK